MKTQHIHGWPQHVVNKALGVGDANGDGVPAGSTEGAMAGDDDRRRWVDLHMFIDR